MKQSVECYKASAYRAALLFSFLGFQTIIKERILDAKTPGNYEDKEWAEIQQEFRDEDSWDKKVIAAVQNKKKPIFHLNDDLYRQYFYWKDRRNDCAHAKGNIIDEAHVQAFWLFLQSNFMKFRVNGSKEYIIQQIKDFFNPTLTPPSAPIDPIIKQIPHSIGTNEAEIFFEELIDITTNFYVDGKRLDTNKEILWERIFKFLDIVYIDILVKLLVKESNRFLTEEIILSYPQVLQFFYREEAFIRSMWKNFKTGGDYITYLDLLRYNLIPDDQLEESFDHMLNNVRSDIFEKMELLVIS